MEPGSNREFIVCCKPVAPLTCRGKNETSLKMKLYFVTITENTRKNNKINKNLNLRGKG